MRRLIDCAGRGVRIISTEGVINGTLCYTDKDALIFGIKDGSGKVRPISNISELNHHQFLVDDTGEVVRKLK